MTSRLGAAVAAGLCAHLAWAAAPGEQVPSARRSVPDLVEARYSPAPLGAQRIEGLLGDRMAVNIDKRLLEGVDPEPLLKGYRQRPGQQTWIGEHIGKFIDAATNAWAYTGDARLKAKLDRAVSDLLATQLDDGYLGTYLEPDRFKDYGDAGFEPSESLPLWDVWAHKYNLLGLLNYYQRTGFEPALAAARRIGDLLCRTYGDRPAEHRAQRLARRHGQHQRARADGDALPSHRRRPLPRVLPLHRARLGRAQGSEDPHHAPDEGARERGRQRQGVRDDVELRRACSSCIARPARRAICRPCSARGTTS